jgi:DNA-binding transcriptional MerR regulator
MSHAPESNGRARLLPGEATRELGVGVQTLHYYYEREGLQFPDR